ncbi:MAG TPA: ABC transporter permease [Gemmatimonadaceae bacterium]|nr:ABC transporter permease [Gemmatimonadaceae bacterium]
MTRSGRDAGTLATGLMRLARRLACWLRFRSWQDGLREEIEFHREMLATDLKRQGLSPDAARAAARRAMGNETYMREEARGVWLSATVEAVLKDGRYAWRGLRRSPLFTAVAVLTLAICIGADTAIFTVMHHVLLAPLPFPDANQIVRLDTPPASNPEMHHLALYPDVVRAWAARSRTVEDLVATESNMVRIGADSTEPLVPGASVTPSFLILLRTPPALGRGFTADDARKGASPVAMIGYGFWRTHYGGAMDVVGRPITVNGVQRTIVGVTASHVRIPTAYQQRTDVWLPFDLDSGDGVLDAVARLRPGVTPAMASRELDAIMREAASDTTWAKTSRAFARRAQDLVDVRQKRSIELLFVAVGVLLVIACANVANLLLMRAWMRRRELAVRRALGAGRLRLARQLLTESLILAVLGGALGLLIGWRGLRAIAALTPTDRVVPPLPIHFDSAVLLWTIALSVATGLLFGVGPALLSGGKAIGDALRSGAQSATGSSSARRLRSGIVVAEVALSMVFVVGATLLLRSFVALERTSIGYDPARLVSVSVELTRQPPTADRAAVEGTLLHTLGALPGVGGAALGNVPQFNVGEGPLAIETPTGAQTVDMQIFMLDFVGSDYFRLVRLPLLQGRTFATTGSSGAANEIIVNRTVARRFWPDGRAVGGRLRIGEPPNAKWLTVVGVAADVQLPGKTGDFYTAQMYRPTSAADAAVSNVVLRLNTSAAPTLDQSVERALKAAGLSGKVARVVWAEQALDTILLVWPRFALILFGLFAAIALGLSALGLYGVMAYSVTQRSREIGLRAALGADPGAVARLILGDSLRLVTLGCGLGIIGAYLAARMLAAFLFETSPADPTSFAAAVILLTSVALLASFVPMRRAVRIDPMDALRGD